MHALLRAREVPISQRSVTNLLARYDELVALAVRDGARLRRLTNPHQRRILALDGLQPDVGHAVLWVLRDARSGDILLVRSLLSATQHDLATLLKEVRDALEVPVAAVVSDGQHAMRKAVASVFPDVPQHLCPLHYVRAAATPICEADRHAKKERKQHVRGSRPLERAVEGWADPAARIVQGDAVAVRSALSDDGPAPRDAPGLRLHERLSQIQARLQRVAETGADQPNAPR